VKSAPAEAIMRSGTAIRLASFSGVVRRGRWLLAVPLLLAAGIAAGTLWKDAAPSQYWLAVTVVGLGLGTGLLLAAIRESLDGTFHTESQAEEALDLPVLAAVPWISSPAERRMRMYRGAIAALWAVATVGAAAAAAYAWLG
jgi:hypothetical protein